MNKKGFTLVELIATVVILAAVLTIAVVSYNSISEKIKEKQYNTLVIKLKALATNYYNDTKMKEFTVEDLMDYGLIQADDNSYNIYDPRDNQSLNTCKLKHIDSNTFDFDTSDCKN